MSDSNNVVNLPIFDKAENFGARMFKLMHDGTIEKLYVLTKAAINGAIWEDKVAELMEMLKVYAAYIPGGAEVDDE